MHKDEVEVKRFQALPVGSKERRKCIDKINKKGQFEWNQREVLNKGELLTMRRPNKKFEKDATGFSCCPNCLGSYSALRKHWNNCTGNPFPGEKIVKELSRKVEKRIHVDASKDLESIITRMHEDEEVLCIRFDWIVFTFANDLCVNLKEVYHHQLVRDKIRSCGKLLLASRLISADVIDFASLFTVKDVNTVVAAIRNVARFDPESKSFESPGTATTLVTLVKTIGNVLNTEYMIMKLVDKENEVTRFLTIFERYAKIKILKTAAVDVINARRWKALNIPSTDDVGKFATYIDKEREECYKKLTQHYSEETWKNLGRLTTVSLLIFNRKRVGDVENILVKEFNRREIIAENIETLSEEPEEMIKSRIPIRGKLYKTVPVLLKHHVDACLVLLLGYRKKAGVPDENQFLFAMPSKCGKIIRLKACTLMRKYSELCEAENPSSLRGTNLRKHFASICGRLGLNEEEVTNVANFMGHSDKVHRDVYGHNSLQREVVKMSNLLQLAEGKNNSTIGQVGPSDNKVEKKRKEKQSIIQGIIANDSVGSSNVKAGKKRKKKNVDIVPITKWKQIETRLKIVKRKISSKPYSQL